MYAIDVRNIMEMTFARRLMMTDFGEESCGKVRAGHRASIKVYIGATTHDACITCVVMSLLYVLSSCMKLLMIVKLLIDHFCGCVVCSVVFFLCIGGQRC